MSLRRAGFVFLLPLTVVAYACSSDDETNAPTAGTDAGVDSSIAVPGNDASSGGEPDSASPVDAGADSDADADVVVSCDGSPLDDAGAVRPIATGRFLDGPQWIDDAIVYSEVDTQSIVRNAPDGGTRAVLRATGLENLPIGNGRSGGFLYTALSRTATGGGKGAILRMLLDGGDPTGFDAGEANSPNDLVASSKGYVYFTDPGYQTDGISTGVYRLAPDGAVATIVKYDGGTNARADGIALSADELSLYVGYFDQKRIAKYTLDAEGVASNPNDLPITFIDNPTGFAIDTGGNLWVAESPSNTATMSGRVEVFSATGTKWGEIPFSDSRPTGVAFGGADATTVYITTERGDVVDGTLYAVTSRCSGVR